MERFELESYTVVRRYSDFDWLRKQLGVLMPTVAIPPLPPKDGLPVKNFKDDFIETRNRGLQRFVDRIATHPRLRGSGKRGNVVQSACSRPGCDTSVHISLVSPLCRDVDFPLANLPEAFLRGGAHC